MRRSHRNQEREKEEYSRVSLEQTLLGLPVT